MKDKIKNILKKVIVYIPILNKLYFQRSLLRTSVHELSQKVLEDEKEIERLKFVISETKTNVDNQEEVLVMSKLVIERLKGLLADSYFQLHFLPKLNISKVSKSQVHSRKLENVLTINQGDKGGAAKVALRLADSLSQDNYKVDILLGENEFALKGNIHLVQREYSEVQSFLKEFQKDSSWDDLLNFSSERIKDLQIFKNADVIHFHNLQGAGGYFSLFDLVELSTLKPTVWTLHDMLSVVGDWKYYLEANEWDKKGINFPYTNPEYEDMTESAKFNLKAKQLIYEKIDTSIVCPAQWLVDKLKDSVLKDKEVHLIHNGIEETIFKPYNKDSVRKELGLPVDKKILLFQANSGKYNVWKGPEYLDRALQYFKSRDDIIFLNIGGDDIVEPGWVNISYINDEETMSKYFSAADIFIYPSLADICPLTVLEAQSCGLPVVAFKTGGVPEIVSHMETGYVSGYKDTADFIKGIDLLLKDSDLRLKLSFNSRKNIISEFTLDKMKNKYIKVYEEAIWKKSSR